MEVAMVRGLVFFLAVGSLALGQETKAPIEILLISGSAEYQSEPSLVEFQEYLEKNYPVRCKRSFGKDGGKDLPGLEALETADVMVVFARRMTLPAEQLDRVKKFCASGKGIVGLRTASHAFQNWPGFDREVLGGDYKGHYGPTEAEVKVEEKAKSHPVLAGVESWKGPGKLYRNPSPAPDVTMLLTTTAEGKTEPAAWVRERKEGRVFYTSLGIPEDFKNENFRRMLVNALFWVAKREPKK